MPAVFSATEPADLWDDLLDNVSNVHDGLGEYITPAVV